MVWEESLKRALDVTRVARVTGLDRTAVAVACAVRPTGHILQVSNGKGITEARAVRSALAEAAELRAAETVDPARLIWDSYAGLRRRVPARAIWTPDRLGSGGACDLPELWSAELRLAWFRARDLSGGDDVYLPAQALFCQAEDGTPLGPQLVRWSTNGMGAHPSLARATLHALLEAVERHQLARAAPEGWTAALVRRRRLGIDARVPRTARLVKQVERRGFEVFLFDLSAARGPRLPVASALLVDREGSAIPLTAGYACQLTPDDALEAALLEAAQSRLTDVHGAREDVEPMDLDAAAALRALCRVSRPTRAVGAMPALAPSAGLADVLATLHAAGHRRVARAELGRAGEPLHVVKVVVPDFQVSELL